MYVLDVHKGSEAATKQGTDVIVMGVDGRSALDQAVFGSTTNQVIRAATCPVVTLRRERSAS